MACLISLKGANRGVELRVQDWEDSLGLTLYIFGRKGQQEISVVR